MSLLGSRAGTKFSTVPRQGLVVDQCRSLHLCSTSSSASGLPLSERSQFQQEQLGTVSRAPLRLASLGTSSQSNDPGVDLGEDAFNPVTDSPEKGGGEALSPKSKSSLEPKRLVCFKSLRVWKIPPNDSNDYVADSGGSSHEIWAKAWRRQALSRVPATYQEFFLNLSSFGPNGDLPPAAARTSTLQKNSTLKSSFCENKDFWIQHIAEGGENHGK